MSVEAKAPLPCRITPPSFLSLSLKIKEPPARYKSAPFACVLLGTGQGGGRDRILFSLNFWDPGGSSLSIFYLFIFLLSGSYLVLECLGWNLGLHVQSMCLTF